jgi:hypothetical protein
MSFSCRVLPANCHNKTPVAVDACKSIGLVSANSGRTIRIHQFATFNSQRPIRFSMARLLVAPRGVKRPFSASAQDWFPTHKEYRMQTTRPIEMWSKRRLWDVLVYLGPPLRSTLLWYRVLLKRENGSLLLESFRPLTTWLRPQKPPLAFLKATAFLSRDADVKSFSHGRMLGVGIDNFCSGRCSICVRCLWGRYCKHRTETSQEASRSLPNDGRLVQEDCIPDHQRRLQTANERMMRSRRGLRAACLSALLVPQVPGSATTVASSLVGMS